MKNFIIEQLNKLKVKDNEKLLEYVDFCLLNDKGFKIKFETSHHHILPKAKNLPFENFSNLDDNKWNGVHLSHKDHYIAHWLLYEAVSSYSVIKSFIAMHEKDSVLRNIEDVLICAEKYDLAKQEHAKFTSIHMNEIIEDGKTRSQIASVKQWETKRIKGNIGTGWQLNTPESIAKQVKTMMTVNLETGLTRAQEISRKSAETKKNSPILECPHCGIKSRGSSNMTRYHFDNCPVNKGLVNKESFLKKDFNVTLYPNEISQYNKKGKQRIERCPYCEKEGGISNMVRYHFNNCKFKNGNN